MVPHKNGPQATCIPSRFIFAELNNTFAHLSDVRVLQKRFRAARQAAHRSPDYLARQISCAQSTKTKSPSRSADKWRACLRAMRQDEVRLLWRGHHLRGAARPISEAPLSNGLQRDEHMRLLASSIISLPMGLQS